MSISINVTPAASGGTFTVGSVNSETLTLEVTGGIGPPGTDVALAAGAGISITQANNTATISSTVQASANLADLSDVALGNVTTGQVLAYNGTAWAASADNALTLSTSAGSDLGTAAIGTSGEAARADHVHNLPTFSEITNGTATATGNLTLNASTGSVTLNGGTAGSASLTLNCEQNTHGVTIQGPPHSAGATYTLTLPTSDGAANQVLQTDGSGSLSWANQSAGGGGITWATEPAASNSTGNAGQIAYGSGFFYLHDGTNWRRAALATFGSETPTITITTQPENLTLADGGSGNLAVAATVSDGSTPSYQWQNSDDSGATWDTLTGSTGTTYTLANVSAADNGTQYRAIVSATGAADVASDVATLTVGAVAETFDLLTEASDRLITETGDSLDHDSVTGTLTAYGSPIQADASGDQMGTAVAISDDGNRVIVAAGYNDAAGVVAGQVKVLEYAGGAWSVLATEYGDAAGDNCGDGVDMSADGSVVAVTFSQSSSSGTGYCRVFAEVGGSWVQRGSDFTNASIIALDDAGDTAAVASRGGGLWVYDWSGTDWVLRGGTQSTQVGGITHINGGLSLSGDGSLVATSSMTYNSGAGGATVQRWTGTNWVSHGGQVLSSSDSTNGGTQYFGKSVDISSDGTVLVVGEITSSSSSTGKVKAYSWNGTTWVQRGSTLTDAVTNDQKGFSVSVNGDGTVLVATSRIPRTVSVYQWDGSDWQLADTDTGYGEQVAINSAGTRIAAGHTDAGVDAVQTFTYE